MIRSPRPWLLLIVGLFLSGCVAAPDVCIFDVNANLAFNLPPEQCPDEPSPCYQDFDKDGFGPSDRPVFLLGDEPTCGVEAEPFRLYSGPPDAPTECEGDEPHRNPDCYRLTRRGQDCDDSDDMRFPTNPEVCDGIDNDCATAGPPPEGEEGVERDPLPDFDSDHEELLDEDFHLFTCSPPDSTIRVFVRGGGYIGSRPFDGRSLEVGTEPGDSLDGLLRLRFLVPVGLEPWVTGGAALSWKGEGPAGWMSFDSLGLHFDRLRPNNDGKVDRFIDVDVPLDQGFVVPGSAAEGTTYYVRIAASIGFDLEKKGDLALDLSDEHVGSLTLPDYCLPWGEFEPPGCGAVWSILLPDPDDPQGEPFDIDRNIEDLDDLDLAACRPFGAANAPMLFDAFGDGPGPGACDFTLGDECIPITVDFPLGCNFAKVVVTDR